DSADLFGKRAGPGLLAADGSGRRLLDKAFERAGDRNGSGSLILRPEPADVPPGLLRAALRVQGDHAGENLVSGEVARPAVGVEDSAIELIVELAQDADQPRVVKSMVLRRKLLVPAKLFEDVVHIGEGQRGMKLLLALAVGVEALGDVADGLLL